MNEPEPVSEALQALIDDYLAGLLDAERLRALEDLLRADAAARRHFVRYARLHTDLHLEVRARQAGARALDHLAPQAGAAAASAPAPSPPAKSRGAGMRWLAVAAGLLLALGVGVWLLLSGRTTPDEPKPDPAVAWLVNAQDCRWADAVEPAGSLEAGKVVDIERGLVEVRFRCGARVVLEGPARLELLSGKSARLARGKLTARVPEEATGFEILSPQGKVIDLGTEFGMEVAADGGTDVYVFQGQVEAHPAGAGGAGQALKQHEAAHIAGGKVTRKPGAPDAERFVRAIVPRPVLVPRARLLRFDGAVADSLRDANGLGTGLTHRLPGTGRQLAAHDGNLRLDLARGHLELTTTESDLNTRYKLNRGEYLGVRLADLGFTGTEDFSVTATIRDIPALEFIGQFGLYAGARNDRCIRGGLLSKGKEASQYTQFLVNNHGGLDANLKVVGLLATGNEVRFTLERKDGKYALTVDNLTDGSSSTLRIRHPDYLDNERDLYVGLFGANPRGNAPRTLLFTEFRATVWAVAAPVGQ
jgi:ferric-dicitrate binding protein FerR (iron transport regulator)